MWGGLIFIFTFWILGYDGITFSDDIFYLTAGQRFWEGKALDADHHFSDRIGSFIFSGLFTYIFGFSDRIGSIPSLLSYTGILLIAASILRAHQLSWTIIFLTTQVYFLHFLSKVYPDSLLACWVLLVPVASMYRHRFPMVSAGGLMFALIAGFMTKETMIFLLPFPLVLFFLDYKSGKLGNFHWGMLLYGVSFSLLYFGYYAWFYGDAFYRIQAVHQGHYISEYTFFDKDVSAIWWRVSIGPLFTFVERGYWLWLILAVPAFVSGLKQYRLIYTEFAWTLLLLLIGFWWMSTSLEYYNPLHLNPRHLLILVPITSILIGIGFKDWLDTSIIRKAVVLGLFFGAFIGIIAGDWKQVAFLGAFAGTLALRQFLKGTRIKLALGFLLLIPVVFSVYYQYQVKNYQYFTKMLHHVVTGTDEPIIVNNFVDFSKTVLLTKYQDQQSKLIPIEALEDFRTAVPEHFTWFIYNYYLHAYPKEIVDIIAFEEMIEEMGYELIHESSNSWVQVLKYKLSK